MSTYVSVPSVCGGTTMSVDMYDTPTDVVCCDNCKSILMCRRAWDHLYK